MYGITFDLDAHILEDELGVTRKEAHRAIEGTLATIGYVKAQYSVFVCPKPKHNELLVVHETIETLKALPWFAEAATRVVAFELDSYGDLLGAFKEA